MEQRDLRYRWGIIMVSLVLMGPLAWAQATRQAEWDALNAQVGQLYQEGKYTE